MISLSDFEAVLGRDKEKVFRPLYTLQVVQDLESSLVLGYEVFAQATDAGTLMPLRQRAHELTGVWLEQLLTDSAYASALDLVDCTKAGVDLYAPYQENDQTERRRSEKPHRQIPRANSSGCLGNRPTSVPKAIASSGSAKRCGIVPRGVRWR